MALLPSYFIKLKVAKNFLLLNISDRFNISAHIQYFIDNLYVEIGHWTWDILKVDFRQLGQYPEKIAAEYLVIRKTNHF